MSQSRVRKAPGGSEAGKNRASTVKASGDTAPCKPKEQNQRSKSKSKIPKSIRYELDNALVGLCDVWFEEIKPHLVRNNIKLHVDGSSSGGSVASGDHGCLPVGAPGCSHLDPGAVPDRYRPSTANSAGCCSTRPTVLRVPCLRLPAQPPLPGPLLLPQSSPPTRRTTLDLTFQNKPTRRQSHHYPRTPPTKLYRKWRTPRRCATQSMLKPIASTRNIARTIQAILPGSATQIQKGDPNMLCQRVKFDKLSQTDPVAILSMFPQSSPNRQAVQKRNNLKVKISKPTVTATQVDSETNTVNIIAPHIPPLCLTFSSRKQRPIVFEKKTISSQGTTSKNRIQKSRPASPENSYTHNSSRNKSKPTQKKLTEDKQMASPNRHTFPKKKSPQNEPIPPQNLLKSPKNISSPHKTCRTPHSKGIILAQQAVKPHSKPVSPQPKARSSQMRSASPKIQGSCERCPGTLTFHPNRSNKSERPSRTRKQDKGPCMEKGEVRQLFDSELINIIADKNDKRLRLLYQSPERKKSDSSTILNLYSSPEEKPLEVCSTKKTRPWR